jgi:hypothetical protein
MNNKQGQESEGSPYFMVQSATLTYKLLTANFGASSLCIYLREKKSSGAIGMPLGNGQPENIKKADKAGCEQKRVWLRGNLPLVITFQVGICLPNGAHDDDAQASAISPPDVDLYIALMIDVN